MSTNTVQTPDVGAIKDVASEFKKGYKTTEWWLAALSAVIPAGAWLAKLFGYDVETEELVAATTGLVPGIGYILQRGWVKKQRNVTVAQVASQVLSAATAEETVRTVLNQIMSENPELAELVKGIEDEQDELARIRDEVVVHGDPEADDTDTMVPPAS